MERTLQNIIQKNVMLEHVAQIHDSTLISFHHNVKTTSKEARHGHFDMIFDKIVEEIKKLVNQPQLDDQIPHS